MEKFAIFSFLCEVESLVHDPIFSRLIFWQRRWFLICINFVNLFILFSFVNFPMFSSVIRSDARSNLGSIHRSSRAGKLASKAVAVSTLLPCSILAAYSC